MLRFCFSCCLLLLCNKLWKCILRKFDFSLSHVMCRWLKCIYLTFIACVYVRVHGFVSVLVKSKIIKPNNQNLFVRLCEVFDIKWNYPGRHLLVHTSPSTFTPSSSFHSSICLLLLNLVIFTSFSKNPLLFCTLLFFLPFLWDFFCIDLVLFFFFSFFFSLLYITLTDYEYDDVYDDDGDENNHNH